MPTHKRRIRPSQKISSARKIEVEKPADIHKTKFGRNLYLTDSKGNFVKDPLIAAIDRGMEIKPVEPHRAQKINEKLVSDGILRKFPVSEKSLKSSENTETLAISEIAAATENIVLITAYYTPNPFAPSLGGHQRFPFRAGFTTSLPSEYTCTITMFLDDELKVTKSETFNTEGFEYNPLPGRYEKEDFEEVRVPAEDIAEVFSGQIIPSVLAVYFTLSEGQTVGLMAAGSLASGSSSSSKVCTGVNPECDGASANSCDCCKDCACIEAVIKCDETTIRKRCREQPECSINKSGAGCSGGSCAGGGASMDTLLGNVRSTAPSWVEI